MKYLTIDYYLSTILSDVYKYLTADERAKEKDERYYGKVYEKRYLEYEKLERSDRLYNERSEYIKIMQKEYGSETTKLSERATEILYSAIYGDEEYTVYDFDENICKRRFEEQINFLIYVYGRLPKNILARIADIRIFALGYATAEVKKLIRRYCKKLQDELEITKAIAFVHSRTAESKLPSKCDFKEYYDLRLIAREEKDDGIRLYIEDDHYIFVKDGEIIEGKDKPIYPNVSDKPNSPTSTLITNEVHTAGELFELHLLMQNCDEFAREDIWYLTIRGTDILTVIGK